MLKKLKSFYKSNRVYSILMIISTICIVSIMVGVIIYFFGQTSKNEYGNRLEGIEKVKISEKDKNNIIKELKSNEKVKEVEVDVRGKLIYIMININEGSHNDVEGIAQTSYEKLNKKTKNFYDVQYIVDYNGETKENFPIMGYVKSGNAVIKWTNYVEVD